MKQLKSLTELDALVEKHTPSFPTYLADVGNLHPSHAERAANAKALKPHLLRYHALRIEMSDRKDLDGVWDRALTSLENSVNQGDVDSFRRSIRFSHNLLNRVATEPAEGKPDYEYGEKLRQNLFLIEGSAKQVSAVRPSTDQLWAPSQQITF